MSESRRMSKLDRRLSTINEEISDFNPDPIPPPDDSERPSQVATDVRASRASERSSFPLGQQREGRGMSRNIDIWTFEEPKGPSTWGGIRQSLLYVLNYRRQKPGQEGETEPEDDSKVSKPHWSSFQRYGVFIAAGVFFALLSGAVLFQYLKPARHHNELGVTARSAPEESMSLNSPPASQLLSSTGKSYHRPSSTATRLLKGSSKTNLAFRLAKAASPT